MYKEDKDEELKQLVSERSELVKQHEQRKLQNKLDNEQRRRLGQPELNNVSSDEEFYNSYHWIVNETKIEKRPEIFDAQQEEERQRVFKLGAHKQTDGSYQGDVPLPINPLNVAIVNFGL